MSSMEFISQFNSWPEHIRKKIQEYAEQLFKTEKAQAKDSAEGQKKVREFGSGKGIFKKIPDAKEFNEPLDDFKDYM